MEIYRDTDGTATLQHPTTDTLTADVYRGSTVISADQVVTTTGDIHTTPITWPHTAYDDTLKIIWKNADESFSRVTYVEVVTPIVPLYELDSIFDNNTPDEEKYDAERLVRRIIEVYTGQDFGKFTGVKNIQGNDTTELAMPTPLLSFTEMNDYSYQYEPTAFVIRGEGWFLGQKPGGYYTIKDAPPDEVLDQFNEGIIIVPSAIKKPDFCFNSVYTITGDWGYEYVPVPVVEAAKILLNDYACQDASYRDKYLHSIKSADWRFEFNQGAFDGTGNLKADQLLEPYRLDNISVI